jgi:triacylglycerol lipase
MFGVNAEAALTPFIESNSPLSLLTVGLDVQRSTFEGTTVYTLTPNDPSGKVVVAIHGGAYTVPPTLLHWLDYTSIARDTGATVVVPIYNLATAPNGAGTAGVVVPQIADLISSQIAVNGADNVSVTGDSAGGGIALSAVQYLVANNKPVPSHLVLVSPSLNVSLTNPDIQYVSDPVLNVAQLQADGQLWAGTGTPYARPENDYLVSPLFGSLAGLPPTAVYSGSLDSLSPDALVLRQLASATPGADFTFDLRKGEIHDWALAPLSPEGGAVRPTIYRQLGLV